MQGPTVVWVSFLHHFRRAFALECLRNGMAVYSLQKLMGHADLQVLRRYLAQTTEDILQAHQVGSPVDNAAFRDKLRHSLTEVVIGSV